MAVQPPRRLWCACTIIDYLAGAPRAKPDCDLIIQQAERGECEIVVSALSEAEVVKIEHDLDHDEAEELIEEFFQRPYIVRAALDIRVARRAREIVRRYGLKPLDAVHVATALVYEVPVMETYDDTIIERVDELGLTVRQPQYLGQPTLMQQPAP